MSNHIYRAPGNPRAASPLSCLLLASQSLFCHRSSHTWTNKSTKDISCFCHLCAGSPILNLVHEEECEELETVYKWNQTWGNEFSSGKCHNMENRASKNKPRKTYRMSGEKLRVVHEEKALGVQDTLSSEKHINKMFGKTYKILLNLRASFHFMDKEITKKK